ncbi:MAG: PD-(D/E)XK nuclease family protein [Anaerolineales bacterium]|nr:PD-(D/E)XK nuclease family protein [Anaerolineales bacterium]
MSTTEPSLTDIEALDRQALEALIIDNPELERLEALLGQFNLFEAIGAVRQELRHSDFLAFLLDPAQNHGLGDAFLRQFLLKARQSTALWPPLLSPINLAVWDLDDTLVLREWHNIDILLVNERHRFAVIIENKIDSGEHSGQLDRYWKTMAAHYPDWPTAGLFLTPAGREASAEAYASLDYVTVAALVERLAETRRATLGPDVSILLAHYAQMLRRHIVSESEISELCRRIYQKHRRALDLIYEHRPDQQAVIYDVLIELIRTTPGLVLDQSSKSYIRFLPAAWDVPVLAEGGSWTTTKRILLFQFTNAASSLRLHLTIGPGPENVRSGLFEAARRGGPPLHSTYNKLMPKYHTIYARTFLTASAYEDGDDESRKNQILKQWKGYIEQDLPAMEKVLQSQEWLSLPPAPMPGPAKPETSEGVQ